MNVFEDVKSSVTEKQAAEHYGIKVNRGGMACCPFRNQKHPGMKIDERYHCFACHADGDAISFVAQRYGLRPVKVAKRIAALLPDCFAHLAR